MPRTSLTNLSRPASNRKRKKRVGRGNASGKGTYSTRGLKGQKSRSGGTRGLARRSAFQQLLIRTPKLRGFKRASALVATVNLADLNKHFKEGEIVNPKALTARGLVKKAPGGIKVLSNGTLEKKLTVKVHAFSEAAKQAIKKAGGTAEIVK